MVILPEKPNHCVPNMGGTKAEAEQAAANLASMSSLRDTDKLPHERYALPLTGNSEYGFFSAKPLVSGTCMLCVAWVLQQQNVNQTLALTFGSLGGCWINSSPCHATKVLVGSRN